MRERGTSTVLAAALVGLLGLVAIGLVATGRVVAAYFQATAAADAAALAAAPLTFLGGDPEAEAAEFAEANGASLVRCLCPLDRSLRARTVRVEVAGNVDLPVFDDLTVRARAAAEFDPVQLLGG